jgi:hypothetical protein
MRREDFRSVQGAALRKSFFGAPALVRRASAQGRYVTVNLGGLMHGLQPSSLQNE